MSIGLRACYDRPTMGPEESNVIRAATTSAPVRHALGLAVLALGLWLAQSTAAAQEVKVTSAAIPDYEFDSARNGVFCPTCNFGDGNARLAFTDRDGNLWLG